MRGKGWRSIARKVCLAPVFCYNLGRKNWGFKKGIGRGPGASRSTRQRKGIKEKRSDR